VSMQYIFHAYFIRSFSFMLLEKHSLLTPVLSSFNLFFSPFFFFCQKVEALQALFSVLLVDLFYPRPPV